MGRMSILMVIGFNVLFAVMGFNVSKVATKSYENYTSYYNRSMARHIASSAANMAASALTFNPEWRDGFSNVGFSGGRFSASVTVPGPGMLRVFVTSTYNEVKDTTILILGLSNFSRFAYFSDIEGNIWWITGDTVWGPFHTQQRINVSGNPVFIGKASSKNGIHLGTRDSNPIFIGGYQSGVNLNLPRDFNALKELARTGGRHFNNEDICLQLNADGTATYRIGSWTSVPAYTMPIRDLAPNGVLMAENANLRLKGRLNGRLTVVATGSSGVAKGNVWIDSSVTYNRNPMTDPGSEDMLGIVCDNDVIITDNANNNNPANGVTVHASMLCRSGGFKADEYNRRPVAGTLTVLGGIQQYQRGPVGTFSGGRIVSGFQKNYRYDERLMFSSPPLYPSTGTYEVLSWYE
ncbi:MAG: hypothetical protein FJ215_02560 [Ignavibacteria bacterium]|nr:hypothetical protein [Ignavibacteria bacterium]